MHFGGSYPEAINIVEYHYAADTLAQEQMVNARGTIAPLTSSIAFGREDLKTVYRECLAENRIGSFRSLGAGQAMLHWN